MNNTHTCEYLEYRGEWAELVYPGTENQRWVLCGDNDEPEIMMQVILFCPYCGEDFRADCHWQVLGRPQENKILAKARKAGFELYGWE